MLRVDGGEEPPARIRRFIEGNAAVNSEHTSLDLKLTGLTTGNDRRYVERRLDPVEDVHVLGPARYGRDGLDSAGSVNAVIGPRPDGDGAGSLRARLGDRLDGREFVVSDGAERGAVWRIAKPGLVALFLAALGAGFLALLSS